MDLKETITILEALAAGCSPKTGLLVEHDSVLNEREVIRALQIAINELRRCQHIDKPNVNIQKKKPHKEIDFFQKERFNNLTDVDINEIKEKVRRLGVLKTSNLTEYVIISRRDHPRAYESWSEQEKDLMSRAIEKTNDLNILSECFQRGKGSIESFVKKLLGDSGYANTNQSET